MKISSRLLNSFGFSKTALKNEVAARQLQLLEKSQIGASSERDTMNRGASVTNIFMRRWKAMMGSPSADLNETERATLIARSRDAHRNDPLGRAAVSRLKNNVVSSGLKLKASVDYKALGISEEEAELLNSLIERKFGSWAKNPRECDKRGMLNFYQQQPVAYTSSKVSGDCFALLQTFDREHCEFTTKIQLVETDRVSNPTGKTNSKELQNGIHFDSDGAPDFVYINKVHPGGDNNNLDRGHDTVRVIGKKTGRPRVLHVRGEVERPDQIRTAPFLAPILEPLRKIEDYSSNEIAAATIQSLLSVFIEHDKDSAPEDPDGKPLGSENSDQGDLDSDEIKLGQNTIIDLEEGAKAKLVAPTRPYSNYGPFLEDVIKQLGAAISIPFEELMLYYSSSYSAARAAMLQAWELYLTERNNFSIQFTQPVYECWFDDAVSLGIIPVKNYADPARRAAYTNSLWIGRKRGSIDELREAKSQAQYLKNRTTNHEIEAIKTSGMDYDEVHAGAVRVYKKQKADGLLMSSEDEIFDTDTPENTDESTDKNNKKDAA